MSTQSRLNTAQWASFPHTQSSFPKTIQELSVAWDSLHKGDREPMPSSKRLLHLDPSLEDPEGVTAILMQAWCAFHQGEFAKAVELADGVGLLGHVVANKASGIYADYLEDDEERQREIYSVGMARAQEAIDAFPEDPNAHYFHAFMTGRYSQCISVAQAIKDGLASRVKTDVINTLKHQPKHAEAQLALGLFHAEIINKVGRMVGAVTYGANVDDCMSAFKVALTEIPKSPIAWIEYGNALYLVYGDKKLDESNDAYRQASKLKARDAMEKLDIEYAKASLS